jgi:DeoR/GlpR family transcriptional regulator of sugar metabolism
MTLETAEGPSGISARARRDEIARLVDEDERVSVSELTDRFHVTDASIRRDLMILEDAGRLRRIHGGAVARLDARARGTYSIKQREHRERKARIGAAAAGLLGPGDVAFFDSGTTVAQVAAHVPIVLRRAGAITVVTHSLPVIDEIGDWESPHLICLGGLYLPDYQALVGPQTIATVRELSADIVFLGCDGLTIEAGLTTPHMLVAEVGAALASRSRRIVAVADSSKIGRQGFTPIVPLHVVNVLITDDAADPIAIERLRRLGVEVILA